jgi:hypothetical protein
MQLALKEGSLMDSFAAAETCPIMVDAAGAISCSI